MERAQAVVCEHPPAEHTRSVCEHLLEHPDDDYAWHFNGRGKQYDLVCTTCAKTPEAISTHLRNICSRCFDKVVHEGSWDGIVGQPQITRRPTRLRFEHREMALDAKLVTPAAIQPVRNRPGLYGLIDEAGTLAFLDTASGAVSAGPLLSPEEFPPAPTSKSHRKTDPVLLMSHDGHWIAASRLGSCQAIVVDAGGTTRRTFQREDCRADTTFFPLAFFEHDHRTRLIHGTTWNRLDITDVSSGALLTTRDLESKAGPRGPSLLDYFHSGLLVSPDDQWVLDSGWVWHPFGLLRSWNLNAWIAENPWESENGASVRSFAHRAYYWDGPACWIDACHVAIWGIGEDELWLHAGVRIFNVRTGEETHWFPGPRGWLAADDGNLFSIDETGLCVWDVASGDLLLEEPACRPLCYHPGSKDFLSIDESGRGRVSRIVSNE